MEQKKTWYKRILSMLLCLGLLVGIVPLMRAEASEASLGYSVAGIGAIAQQDYDKDSILFLPLTFHGRTPTAAEMVADGYDIDMVSETTNYDSTSVFSDGWFEDDPANGTVGIKLFFINRQVSTITERDFCITIQVLKNEAVECEINGQTGTFHNPSPLVDVTDNSYVMVDENYGTILHIAADANNVTSDFGNGLKFVSNLPYEKQSRYYVYAQCRPSSNPKSYDIGLVEANEEIELIYYIDTVGILGTETALFFDLPVNYYVHAYDNSGFIYLGTTAQGNVEYAHVELYLATKRLDKTPAPPPAPLPTYPTNDGDRGSSGGGGGNSTPDSMPSTTASSSTTSSNVNSNGEVSASKIASEASNALKGTESGTAVIKTQNAKRISPATLESLAKQAANAGKDIIIHADTLSANGAVQGRLYVEPKKLKGLTNNLNLGVYTEGKEVNSTKGFFDKYFDNDVEVVHFTQTGSFGASLEVAAKVDTSKLSMDNLIFYSYDRSTNTYSRIANANAKTDKNGYLHFFTERAGDIIITDKPLTKK